MSRMDEAYRKARRPDLQVPVAPESDAAGPATPSTWSVGIAPADGTAQAVDVAAETATPVPASGRSPSLALFRGFHPAVREKLVVLSDASSVAVEQYRKLAATLHHAQLDRGLRVVMVTSAVTGEGKTLTATNLALTFSESYKRRVLLVDADLRRPSLHDVFQIPNVSGLSDALRAPAAGKLTLVEVSATLALLTAGRPTPDPMQSLTSDRMTRIVREAAERFDWVVIDSPPVAMMPDASLLASMVDAVLLVVGAGETDYRVVQKAVDSVGRERILGVVLNGGEGPHEMDAYYPYGDRYGWVR